MLILTAAVVVLVVGIWLVRYDDTTGMILSVVGGMGLFFLLAILAVNHITWPSTVAGFESVRATVASARARGEPIERAAIQIEIAERNAWLAKARYWNGTLFGLWVPDGVETLAPIE